MSTIPTQNPVPSEAASDLKYNAGKIDEFVTSMKNKYIDRFGQEHFTIEGLRWVAQQAISQFGYITLDSFQKGAEITLPNQVLRDETTGEYYRWDGTFPKSVPVDSTPENSGGIGIGKWLSVGDSSLRSDIMNGRYKYDDSESIYHIPGIDFDVKVDNRDVCYSFNKRIHIPRGVTLRVNLLPNDDVRKFVGDGKLIVKNQYYNFDMIFDISLSTNGNKKTIKSEMYKSIRGLAKCTIGIVGDSISDGAWGKQDWHSPALDSNGNLVAPTSYNHSINGGSHSWVSHWCFLCNEIAKRFTEDSLFETYNISVSGKGLSNDWGYNNFDIGFFGNEEYEKKAPKICILAMGWNDVSLPVEEYKDKIDKFIRKAWGYGCAVAVVSVNNNDKKRLAFEIATKKEVSKYLNVEYFSLGNTLFDYANENSTSRRYYVKRDGDFDSTHPQELGHMSMGASMFMQTIGADFVKKVSSGDFIGVSTADSLWSAIGFPSKKRYDINTTKVAGNSELDYFGYLSKLLIDNENVTLTTFVWCDEESTSISMIEPFTTQDSTSINNNISILNPPGNPLLEYGSYAERNKEINNYRNILSGKIASSYLGKSKTLSTYCGKLKKGLNMIKVIYDGAPSEVYIPMLKFGNYVNDGINIKPTRISVPPSSTPKIIHSTSLKNDDQISKMLFNGTQFSEMPDHFLMSGNLMGKLSLHNGINKNNFILMNFNPKRSTGTIIGVSDDGRICHSIYNKGMPEEWEYVTESNYEGIPFDIWQYHSSPNGGYSYVIITKDMAINKNIGITKLATSGYIGVINASTVSKTIQLEYTAFPTFVA